MIRYKHYSFDLWGTLIKSNPEFKRRRAEYFAERYNPDQLSVEKVEWIISNAGKQTAGLAEATAAHVPASTTIGIVLMALGHDLTALRNYTYYAIHEHCQQLFVKYPALLFDEDTRSVLEQLHRDGATLSILSNTGLIEGCTLTMMLEDLDIARYFKTAFYSDQLLHAKPSLAAFNKMKNFVFDHYGRRGKELTVDDIIHVGDNPAADISAAKHASLQAYQVNTSNQTIIHLLN